MSILTAEGPRGAAHAAAGRRRERLFFTGMSVVFLVYDLAARGRVHRATLWGGLLLVASHPLRLLVGQTQAGLTFAEWLTQWS